MSSDRSLVDRLHDRARAVANGFRYLLNRTRRRSPSLRGHAPADEPTPALASLGDRDLERLNKLLPWNCFTVDDQGRRFGDVAWAGKRQEPQLIPDPRIVLLDELVELKERRVLELGCFEGVHTIALCERSSEVTAVDARVDNAVKTVVRTNFYGAHPQVLVRDVDQPGGLSGLDCDVCFHVGVLYHLTRPVEHLQTLLPLISTALMLDTHVASDDECDGSDHAAGLEYRFRTVGEAGRADPFSGMSVTSRWVTKSTLEQLLQSAGFRIVHEELRGERNGARINLVATRSVTPT